VHVLTSVTFVYVIQQDRILAAINPGDPEAWSCWLTRRVVLAVLEQARDILAKTSALAQRAPLEARGQIIAFERHAAITETAPRMNRVTAEVLNACATSAELVERLSITNHGDSFKVELRGLRGGGAAGLLRRVGLQRILQMLEDEVAKAGWIDNLAKAQPAPTVENHDLPH
jgi:hypothetical protein